MTVFLCCSKPENLKKVKFYYTWEITLRAAAYIVLSNVCLLKESEELGKKD